jgi:murein DD-endopeptidase MepM/ murein hydrolase activator NlpD
VKGLLLFLAGGLVGANLLYLAVTRDPAPGGRAPAPGMPTPAIAPAGDSKTAPPPAEGTLSPAITPGSSGPSPSPPVPVAPTATTVASAPAATAGLQPLLVPVQGVVAGALQDTFNDARAQGRSHEAIDIMAPAGTPVLAVADGSVEKLFTSVAGGLTVYQFEPSGQYAYYYAHLQGYAPGLAERQALRRGDVIGYVGSTGNANPAAPHLHFAVFQLGPERRWWQGTAINPYPLLRGQ